MPRVLNEDVIAARKKLERGLRILRKRPPVAPSELQRAIRLFDEIGSEFAAIGAGGHPGSHEPALSICANLGAAEAYTRLGLHEKVRSELREAGHTRISTLLEAPELEERLDTLAASKGLAARLASEYLLEGTLVGEPTSYQHIWYTLEEHAAVGLFSILRFDFSRVPIADPDVRLWFSRMVRRTQTLLRASGYDAPIENELWDTAPRPVSSEPWGRSVVAGRSMIDSIVESSGVYRSKGTGRNDIKNAMPKCGALVQLCATDREGIATIREQENAEDFSFGIADHVVVQPSANNAVWEGLLADWRRDYAALLSRYVRGAPLPVEEFLAANASLRVILRQLWDLLIGPIVHLLNSNGIKPGADVVLLPTGVIAALPLHAAIAPDGRVFGDEYTVRYCPSVFIASTLRLRLGAMSSPNRLLGAFNPDGTLPLAETQELRDIENLFGATNVDLLSPDELTGADITRRMHECGYLHLACHGAFDAEAPEKSGLHIGGGKYLTIDEILLDVHLFQTRLVFLSACESGATDVSKFPDEHVGLPSAFLCAGACGVVSTQWSVFDAPTATVAREFYERTLAGATPAKALQIAVRSLRSMSLADFAQIRRAGVSTVRATEHTLAGEISEYPLVWAPYGMHGQ